MGLLSIGWFTISNSTRIINDDPIAISKWDAHSEEPEKYFPGEYLDLRPSGYVEKQNVKSNSHLNDNLVQNRSKRTHDEEIESKNNNLVGSDFRDPSVDYEEFISNIENANNEYRWSRFAQEILERTGRAADFIGHKIEKRVLFNQVNHSRSLNFNKLALAHFLSLTTAVPSMLSKKYDSLRLLTENKLNNFRPNEYDIALQNSQGGLVKQYSNIEYPSQHGDDLRYEYHQMRNKLIHENSGHKQSKLNIPKKNRHQQDADVFHGVSSTNSDSSDPQRFRRRDVDSWGLERHRIECWASNTVGASKQPCVFLISKVGEFLNVTRKRFSIIRINYVLTDLELETILIYRIYLFLVSFHFSYFLIIFYFKERIDIFIYALNEIIYYYRILSYHRRVIFLKCIAS